MEEWNEKEVPLTWSAELTGLDSHSMYAIRVAAATRQGIGRLSELITVRVTPTGEKSYMSLICCAQLIKAVLMIIKFTIKHVKTE